MKKLIILLLFPISLFGQVKLDSTDLEEYTTTEFVIYPHEVISWERGWDYEGNQKWGPTNGPYIYSKVLE